MGHSADERKAASVSTRERPVDVAARRARAALAELGEEARRARLEHGLSQAEVGRAIGISRAHVGRVERGELPGVPLRTLGRQLAAVGRELSVRAYPAGAAVRDATHLALLRRLRSAVEGWGWHVRLEVPMGGDSDGRAWDALLTQGAVGVAVEAETRVRDLQALFRRVGLKQRDSGVGTVVLLLSATRTNRLVIRDYREELATAFPTSHPDVLRALARREAPPSNGVVLL